MRVGFGTVIYKQAFPLLNDFLSSLLKQTYHDFELLIISEGVAEEQLLTLKNLYKGSICLKQVPEGTPIYFSRIFMLQCAKEKKYDLLILGDCDDRFAYDRIEKIVLSYNDEYRFFYNPLRTFEGNVLFQNLPEYSMEDQILEENYLGLSNTALNMNSLTSSWLESLKEGKTNIFDWYLFARLTEDGGVGRLVPNTYTEYRIYENNMSGTTVHSIEKEIDIKIEHYNLLSIRNTKYVKLLKKYEELKRKYREGKLDVKENKTAYWWGQLKYSKNL